MRVLTILAAFLIAAGTAAAQDRPNTILVLDGSGSMWGQIDGVAKITIAQEVVGNLLDTLPTDQRLGLTVYGHRERGNCTDIETIVPAGEGTRDAIRAAVNGIQPLGKTPMTDSVIAAAESLRYTEDSATVILISDGVETCNPDPCAAARLMEETGIDFTPHVIGFDVAGDAEALLQMQCIADETGGQFIPAANASELTAALTTVVDEPVLQDVTLRAVTGDESGPTVEDQILWSVSGPQGAVIVDEAGNPKDLSLGDGSYNIVAYRIVDEREMTATVTVASAETTATVIFPEPTPQVTIDAPDTVPAGSIVMVGWTGPDAERDNVQIGMPGDTSYSDYTYTRDGSPLPVQIPFEAGTYELRYKLNDREVIATKQITVTPFEVGLEAPDSVSVGSTFDVSWTGPDAARDNVQIGPVGETGYSNYAYTNDGNPVSITAPGTPGPFELRYKFMDSTIVFTQPIEITAAEVTLDFPPTVSVGSTFEVTWTGPDTARDNVQIGPVGETGYSSYAYTDRGNPATLTAPSQPGDYELRYKILDRDIIHREPITVAEVDSTLVAPDTAPIGATIQVGWDGPDNDRDYISVGKPGENYVHYTYTREGNPLNLVLPVEPGAYEIRYQLREGGSIITSAPIEVTDLKGNLTAPETAAAGSMVSVGWDGPDYDSDYISVGLPDDRYTNYTYTRAGNPVELQMPTEPGTYQLRYQMRQDGKILATRDITLTETQASLVTPPTAAAGETITVGWDGPGYDRDYISVAQEDDGRSINYTRISDGNPVDLLIPSQPGDYVITYRLNQGDEVIASNPITLTDVKADLVVPGTATAGEMLSIAWEGPGYPRDYIAVSTEPDGRTINYDRVSANEPALIAMPPEPGDYYIVYRTNQDDRVLFSQAITVTDVAASVTAPATARIAEPIELTWEGPDFRRDYIAVSAEPDGRTIAYARTSSGNPVTVTMPSEPGSYFIVYRMGQGDRVLFSQQVEVANVKGQLVAPSEVAVGDDLPVGWDGPDFPRDRIALADPATGRTVTFARPGSGNPVMLRTEVDPGEYDLQYQLGNDHVIIARQAVRITE